MSSELEINAPYQPPVVKSHTFISNQRYQIGSVIRIRISLEPTFRDWRVMDCEKYGQAWCVVVDVVE